MNIGIYKAGLIGDNIVALHGIYAIKALFPAAKLIVYTNAFGINLYKNFSFIDILINVENLDSSELISDIDSRNFSHFLLTQPNRAKARLMLKTKLRKIITFRTFYTFINQRFKTIFFSRNYSNVPQYLRILKLVSLIDSNIYNKNIKNIDFSAIRLTCNDSNKMKVQEFLSNAFHTHNIESKANLAPKLVLINPFVRTTFCNLTLQGWIECIGQLSNKHKNINFCIPTYAGNIGNSEIYTAFKDTENIAIFENDNDLLNIVALLERTNLLISPSTGISHIANNLCVPMIWLCSRRDKSLWAGDNMSADLFITLKETSKEMTRALERKYIAVILEKFEMIIK